MKKLIMLIVVLFCMMFVGCTLRNKKTIDTHRGIKKTQEILNIKNDNSIVNNKEKEGEKCNNGVCYVDEVIQEDECREKGFSWDDVKGKCLDTTKKQLQNTVSSLELECRENGGVYRLNKEGEYRCFKVQANIGASCVQSRDCDTSLCKVISEDPKKGICVTPDITGCNKYFFKGKIVRVCK